MSDIFTVDGPLYRGLSRWAELIVLGVVWWLLMLPVITAPVATSWLCHSVRQTRDGIRMPRMGEIVHYVRHNFWICLRLAALLLAVMATVLVALVGPSPGGWYGQLVFAVGLLVGCTVALVAPWSVALIDSHDTVRNTVRAAYLRAMSQLSLAFLSATSVVGGVAALLFAPGSIRLITLLAVPGLLAALVTRLCDRAQTRTTSTREPLPDAPSPDEYRLGRAI